jgi:hypothetical protein
MKKLLFIILLTLPFVGFGQGWERTFGGPDNDYGYCVQQTNDGGYIVTGRKTPSINDGGDVWLLKTDGIGNLLWEKNYDRLNNPYSEKGMSVKQTNDGGYIITGLIWSSVTWLIKTDSFGDTIWTKEFGGGGIGNVYGDGMGHSVQQTTDGGYIISSGRGTTGSFTNGVIKIIKTDSFGDSLWTKTYSGHGVNTCIEQTTDGGFVITGTKCTNQNSESCDVWLIKLNSTGNELWNTTYGNTVFGGDVWDQGNFVQQTLDGGYIIIGSTLNYLNTNNTVSNYSDVWLIKTDPYGVKQWDQTFGFSGSSDDRGKCVQQTSDGGYILVGWRNGGSRIYLIKTDGNGQEIWTKSLGGSGTDRGYYVQQTNDGGYIITGETSSFNSSNYEDLYLIKTDGNGNITSTFNIPISSNKKLEKLVDILGRETKPQTNTPFIEIYDDGSTEKKIVVE